jgi:hypothetical protein
MEMPTSLPTSLRPLHITIEDVRLRTATRIAAALAGVSIRTYLTRLLMADEQVKVSLAYVDNLTGEDREMAFDTE